MNMDIAALSVNMHQTSLQQDVSIALMKKTMNIAQVNAQAMNQLLMQAAPAPHPTSGHHIDVKG
ncbi:YjfB family protein [Priestia koreensis]|uniref:YjfB family protein n=2 Tax=Priestia koreensis TaxID=284581 RepID=UPI003EBAAD21